jgi:ABC-type dipeptide/oligopeptide/nickel transport system permease subunit
VAVEIAIVGVISDVTTGLIPVGLSIPNAILATVVLTALGTTFVGPFAALGTIPAAAIWAAVMRAKLRRHRAP